MPLRPRCPGTLQRLLHQQLTQALQRLASPLGSEWPTPSPAPRPSRSPSPSCTPGPPGEETASAPTPGAPGPFSSQLKCHLARPHLAAVHTPHLSACRPSQAFTLCRSPQTQLCGHEEPTSVPAPWLLRGGWEGRGRWRGPLTFGDGPQSPAPALAHPTPSGARAEQVGNGSLPAGSQQKAGRRQPPGWGLAQALRDRTSQACGDLSPDGRTQLPERERRVLHRPRATGFASGWPEARSTLTTGPRGSPLRLPRGVPVDSVEPSGPGETQGTLHLSPGQSRWRVGDEPLW